MERAFQGAVDYTVPAMVYGIDPEGEKTEAAVRTSA